MAVHISLAVLHASKQCVISSPIHVKINYWWNVFCCFNSCNEYARGRIWTFKDALPQIFTIHLVSSCHDNVVQLAICEDVLTGESDMMNE
ncbi:hypothetical protein Tco_1353645 [Tanacetum coccineum]